jgi:methylenetetrahydrofolate dehydrogenase (NADP+)/methenyltetrahydrofolate cyclohydrolase
VEKLMLGKPVADKITKELKTNIDQLNTKPKLAIVRVGQEEADMAYERAAIKRMESIGILWDSIELPRNISEAELISKINELNEDKNVNGILLFNPLPNHLDSKKVGESINPLKDVDSLNPINLAKVMYRDENAFAPCTPTAAMEILDYYGVEVEGKHAVVLGRSTVVGKPVSMLLLNRHATVTICHSKTPNIEEIAKLADILLLAIGAPNFADINFVKEGAVVVDIGINVDDSGNLCGDVNMDSVIENVDLITPVPGGVGSVTTAVLAKHVVKAYIMQQNIE